MSAKPSSTPQSAAAATSRNGSSSTSHSNSNHHATSSAATTTTSSSTSSSSGPSSVATATVAATAAQSVAKAVKPPLIREVWANNLVDEMRVISDVLEEYPYVAIDTEFPGVVARPVGSFKNSSEYHYRTVKCNVDMLKIIQIGVTFLDEEGHLKPGICTWQFNFNFDLTSDMFAQDSIELLQNSGINFADAPLRGIDPQFFGEVLITSGLVLNDEVKWISFHGGYDFAYLTKILSCKPLPESEGAFFHLLRIYFPYLYDVKQIMKSCDNLQGGLNAVAASMHIDRVGTSHQAGSDSMLTGRVFFKIADVFFDRNLDDSKFSGQLWGMGHDLPVKNRRGITAR